MNKCKPGEIQTYAEMANTTLKRGTVIHQSVQ